MSSPVPAPYYTSLGLYGGGDDIKSNKKRNMVDLNSFHSNLRNSRYARDLKLMIR